MFFSTGETLVNLDYWILYKIWFLNQTLAWYEKWSKNDLQHITDSYVENFFSTSLCLFFFKQSNADKISRLLYSKSLIFHQCYMVITKIHCTITYDNEWHPKCSYKLCKDGFIYTNFCDKKKQAQDHMWGILGTQQGHTLQNHKIIW